MIPRRFCVAAGFQRAVRRLDARQVRSITQAVQVEDIHVIGLEALQAGVHLAQGGVAGACPLRHLRGEDDVRPAGGEEPAHAGLALALAVVHRGVEVVDTEAEGPVEHGGGLIGGIRQEPAAAAHREDGHAEPGPAQRAARHGLRGAGRSPGPQGGEGGGGPDRQAALSDELAPRHPVIHEARSRVIDAPMRLAPAGLETIPTPASRRPPPGTPPSSSRSAGRPPRGLRSPGATSSPTRSRRGRGSRLPP